MGEKDTPAVFYLFKMWDKRESKHKPEPYSRNQQRTGVAQIGPPFVILFMQSLATVVVTQPESGS